MVEKLFVVIIRLLNLNVGKFGNNLLVIEGGGRGNLFMGVIFFFCVFWELGLFFSLNDLVWFEGVNKFMFDMEWEDIWGVVFLGVGNGEYFICLGFLGMFLFIVGRGRGCGWLLKFVVFLSVFWLEGLFVLLLDM